MSTVAATLLVLRLTLGMIFIVSAVTKLRDPAAFVKAVCDYHVLPPRLARLYGSLLPFLEAGVAILLMSGFYPQIASTLATLILASFAYALVIVTIRKQKIPCHCFGPTPSAAIGWHTVARTVVLLLSSLCLVMMVVMDDQIRPTFSEDMPAILVSLLLVALFFIAGSTIDLLIWLSERV